MQKAETLIHALADGRFHSGAELARTLACSRSAVWKHMQKLRQLPGLQVDAVTGRGYRLSPPIELLDSAQITQGLPQPIRHHLEALQVMGSVGSTNQLAMASPPSLNRGNAWLAEHQTAGRGRRGRQWESPYGRNLYLSLGWRFDLGLAQVGALSIAVGAVLAGQLASLGLEGHSLKWPNDLLWQGRKLAGVLLEVQGETQGPAHVVIGIGVNCQLDAELQQRIEQPAVGLQEAGLHVHRNPLAANLLAGLVDLCRTFPHSGLQGYVEQWRAYDGLVGQKVQLQGPGKSLQGTHLGLAADGGLRVQTAQGEQVFYSGELSLRVDQA